MNARPHTPLAFALLLAMTLAVPGFAAEKKPEGKFFGAKETAHPAWFKQSFLDFSDDIKEATAHGKRVMVLPLTMVTSRLPHMFRAMTSKFFRVSSAMSFCPKLCSTSRLQ